MYMYKILRLKVKLLNIIDSFKSNYTKVFLLILTAPLYIKYNSKRNYIIFAIILLLIATPFIIIKTKGLSVKSNIIDYSPIYATGIDRAKTCKIVVHHDADAQDSVKLMDIYELHKHIRGWSCGIAYHYIVLNNNVYKIHYDEDVTAHAYGANYNSISICMHGDFSKQYPTEELYNKVAFLSVILMRKYNLKPEDVIGHREVAGNKTECPGNNFDMDKLRLKIKMINLFM